MRVRLTALPNKRFNSGESFARERHRMADDLMNDIRLRCVEWRRMMANVLRAKKMCRKRETQGTRGLDQAGDGLSRKPLIAWTFSFYFAQLRNAIGRESQLPHTREIFRTSVGLMCGLSACKPRADLMLLSRVGRLGIGCPA